MKVYFANFLIFSGIMLAVGSIGACENGDYSILECVAWIAFGTVLVLAGAEMRKESMPCGK